MASPVASRTVPSGAPGQALHGREVTVGDIAYEITFDRATANARTVRVAMTFSADAPGPSPCPCPAWTPGAYEISNFARYVFDFTAQSGGRETDWDKVDFDTWRVEVAQAGAVQVRFSYMADSLDNAMAWSQPDFLLVNGTNIFLYPESLGADFPAVVTVKTERDWKVATGMRADAGYGRWSASSYHDLVDMPWFIGDFDLDSLKVDGHWNRLATYPAGALAGDDRKEIWSQISRMTPVQSAVFGTTPWQDYTTMMIFEPTFPGGSALEHQNSHVGIYATAMIGSLTLPLVTAHEQFHAWNVKRLRPADMVPYRYDRPQPTPWLWLSEGVTDYYADLALLRSGVAKEPVFYGVTNSKLQSVAAVPAVALEDASLNAWIHPRNGTEHIYYAKGSLAGLMLDILIRDASDNAKSLDDVMQELYGSTFEAGRGFTGDDWWSAVSRAAGGRRFDDIIECCINGRRPFPWDSIAPLAGMWFVADTVREPRIGVQLAQDSEGLHVQAIVPGSMASYAGMQPGDRLVSIGGDTVRDMSFGDAYRQRFASSPEGTDDPDHGRTGRA